MPIMEYTTIQLLRYAIGLRRVLKIKVYAIKESSMELIVIDV